MRPLRILGHQLHLPDPMSEIRHIEHDREPPIRQERPPVRFKVRNGVQPEIVVETETRIRREVRAHEREDLAGVFGFGECGTEEGTALLALLGFPFWSGPS